MGSTPSPWWGKGLGEQRDMADLLCLSEAAAPFHHSSFSCCSEAQGLASSRLERWVKQLVQAKRILFCFVSEKRAHYGGQASCKHGVHPLAQSLKCWDYGVTPPWQTESKILNYSLCDLVSKSSDSPINRTAPRILSRKDSIVTSGLLVQDNKLGILYKVIIITAEKKTPDAHPI